MEMDKHTLLRGVVIFQKANVGSKSESVQPYLYRSRCATMVPIYMNGDNPFENDGLIQYDGQRVEINGMMSRGKFVIEKINFFGGSAR